MKLMVMGIEYDLLIMFILILFCFERFVGLDYGIIVAYVIDQFFVWLFGFLGARNLASKTFTDERFLI